MSQGRDFEGMRYESHTKTLVVYIDQGQADAVDGDRAFAGHLTGEIVRDTHPNGRPLGVVNALVDDADSVDVPAYEMAAQGIANA